jgi:hypothetical protein
LFVGLILIGVTPSAPHLGKALRGMEVRLGFLMAIGASHPGFPVNRRGKSLFVHVKGKEGTVLFPLAESGILVTLETFRVISRQRSADPEEA